MVFVKLLWLRIVLKDMKIKWGSLMKLYYDNKSAISIAHNPIHNDHTKHIETNKNFIRRNWIMDLMATVYVPSKDQIIVDLLKHFLRTNFEK